MQDYFGFDYAFDDLHLGHLHMIALKIPKGYIESYERFKTGEYSKMYNFDDLYNFFGEREVEMKIFTKDKNYQIEFVQKVNDLYNTNTNHITWSGELDFPIKQEEEYFNKLIK